MKIKDYFCRRKTESIELKEVQVSWLGIQGKWVADRRQQTAAWEMYVELITRISVQPLGPEEGLLREALSSLHGLFGETRRILKHHGPALARPLSGGEVTFGTLAVSVLNKILRPFLSRWHPLLQAHEVTRTANLAPSEHERSWAHHDELRKQIEMARRELFDYADLLAGVAGIQALHDPASPVNPYWEQHDTHFQ